MAVASVSNAAESLVLAERGKPAAYSVVIRADAGESERYAAAELTNYVSRLTGVALPVVVASQSTPVRAIRLQVADGLGEDGFRLRVDSVCLTIEGSPVRGILFGVYELLETYGGVGWFASWHTVVPEIAALSVPGDLDDAQKPAYLLREPLWFDAEKPDFAAHLRLNGHYMNLGARHGGSGWRFGGGLGNAHTMQKLLPPDEFFDEHPEYFALVGGKRVPRGQICLTNPDVLRIVTERVLERIRQDPTARFFGVSQRDCEDWCECPSCKTVDDAAESHAGTMIRFVNEVAKAVEREFPGKIIETLAYQYTRKPPKGIRPRNNVMPCLCPIECDYKEPLDKSGCPENADFIKDLAGWAKLTDNLYIWDYTTNYRHYLMPFPNVGVLQANLRLFLASGAKYMFAEGAYEGRHAEFAELKNWLLAKWMWNPELPAGPLLDRFFSGYYGAAAPYVRQYFDELQALPRDTRTQPLKIFEEVDTPILTDEFLVRSIETLKAGGRAVLDDATRLYNLRTTMMSPVYTLLMRRARRDCKKVWVTANPSRFQPKSSNGLIAFLERQLGESGDVRLSESRSNDDLMGEILKLKDYRVPETRCSSAIAEETELTLNTPGKDGDVVDDPLALNGKAIRLPNTHYRWCVTLRMSEVAYDPSAMYSLRVRVRVEKGKTDGQVFSVGVYDEAGGKSCGERELGNADVGTEYAWYDVLTWKPADSQYLWFAPGWFERGEDSWESTAYDAVYLDCVEITRHSGALIGIGNNRIITPGKE